MSAPALPVPAAGGATPVVLNSVETPMQAIVDELETAAGFLIGTPTLNSNVPHPILALIANMVEGGRTPVLTKAQLEALGYRIAILPAAGFLARREHFHVTDGDSVLEIHARVVIARGQTPLSRNTGEIQLDAAAETGVEDACEIRIQEAVEFAIAHGGCINHRVDDCLGVAAGQARRRNGRCGELVCERNILAGEERPLVIENLRMRNARP